MIVLFHLRLCVIIYESERQMDIIQIMLTQLKALGIDDGDTLLIHSSLKSLGRNVSPGQVIDSIIKAVGCYGTVVFPSLSYLSCNKDNPYFDYYKTRSNVGAIAEYFRTNIDCIRSISPTHSCCAKGHNAEYVISGHILDSTPCGPNSPFNRVKELGGKILFIGCGIKPNTSMHAIEELYEPDYLFGEQIEYKIKDVNNNIFSHKCRSHSFYRTVQRYDRLEQLLKPGKELRTGYVLNAFCHLIDANAMWGKAGSKYRENSSYFVDIVLD